MATLSARPSRSRIVKFFPSSVKSVPFSLRSLTPFLALSRTPHGLLDMTTPLAAACLCLGHVPPPLTALVGLITVFAGYTAVYALNDVVDVRLDRERLAQEGFDPRDAATDLDAALPRHPIAQGAIRFRDALLWAMGWSAVALLGALWLNPMCAAVFIAGCLLEALYCRLFRVSPLRTLVNGVVKTLGSVAAVLAVAPSPPPVFLAVLFTLLFFWEIGGQNIPNDFMDMEEDIRLGARTIPVRLGPDMAAYIAALTLGAAVILLPLLFHVSPAGFILPHYLLLAGAAWLLLIEPGRRFYRSRTPESAGCLFNRASLFPPALLAIVVIRLMF